MTESEDDLRLRVLVLESDCDEMVLTILSMVKTINTLSVNNLMLSDVNKTIRYQLDELIDDYNYRKARKQTDMLN